MAAHEKTGGYRSTDALTRRGAEFHPTGIRSIPPVRTVGKRNMCSRPGQERLDDADRESWTPETAVKHAGTLNQPSPEQPTFETRSDRGDQRAFSNEKARFR